MVRACPQVCTWGIAGDDMSADSFRVEPSSFFKWKPAENVQCTHTLAALLIASIDTLCIRWSIRHLSLLSSHRNVQRGPTTASSHWGICSWFLCSESWSITSSCRCGTPAHTVLCYFCSTAVIESARHNNVKATAFQLALWMLENQVTQVGMAQMFDTIWSPSFQHVCGAFTKY